jgi:hypothetical protein
MGEISSPFSFVLYLKGTRSAFSAATEQTAERTFEHLAGFPNLPIRICFELRVSKFEFRKRGEGGMAACGRIPNLECRNPKQALY